jgi:hypothetical protein
VWVWADKSSWVIAFSNSWSINAETFPITASSDILVITSAGNFWAAQASSFRWSWVGPLDTFWEDLSNVLESGAADFIVDLWTGLWSAWFANV